MRTVKYYPPEVYHKNIDITRRNMREYDRRETMTAGKTPPADFAELVKACTLAAIRKTASRSPGAAEHARRNLEDIQQAAALEALERLADGRGEGVDPAQLVSRSAAAVIRRAWYEASRDARRTTPDTIRAEDGNEIHPAELETRRDGPSRPTEDASTGAADIIKTISAAMPKAYREDAPSILSAAAAGYTGAEIARSTGAPARRVQRILKAARSAAEREIY